MPRLLTYPIPSESDEFHTVVVRPKAPVGWRDAWAVLRGRYVAELVRTDTLTVAGMNRVLDDVWSKRSPLAAYMLQDRPPEDVIGKIARIPVRRPSPPEASEE